jgi:muramoyltetrapeptide carboxypeptidase
MIYPDFLSPGSRVAIIAPSGPQPQDRIQAVDDSIRALGLEPVYFSSCFQHHGYLAGSDVLRAEDVNKAFADPAIEGIICIRGGYGAHRLMKLLDFDTIARHPKFFCGYSDITALHLLMNQRFGFATWHTTMPGSEWHRGLNDFTKQYLTKALFGPFPNLIENPPGIPLKQMHGGHAAGELVGGNLSLVSATLGTFYEIDTRGKSCFLKMWMNRPIV